jgi:lipopolysaccharide/colanic/teichoic acid biosynthesis glycosyltransferase
MKLYPVAKRSLDITVSLVLLLLSLPLLALLAMLIRISMGRPVFFRQQRPGRGGTAFNLVKLKTMRNPQPGEEGAEHDAARLTRVGRLLRSLSLDELPTLWNVLAGDMSLVGPRPLLRQYLGRYTAQQARRHEVLPGITGWAQVNGRNAITWEDKFKYDVWYVDHRSFWLDVKILCLTVVKVLLREGIGYAGEATMPEFKGTKEGRRPEAE